MNPDDYESVTEAVACHSTEVPGTLAHSSALDTNICDECGLLRLFITLEDAEGNRMVASFDEHLAAYWGFLFLNAAQEIAEQNRALGSGFSMN